MKAWISANRLASALIASLVVAVAIMAAVMIWGGKKATTPDATPTPAETPTAPAEVPATVADASATPAVAPALAPEAGKTPDAPVAPAPAPVATPAATPATALVKVFHSDDAEALAEAHKDLAAAVEAVVSVADARFESLEKRVERIETGKTPVAAPAATPPAETQEEAAIRRLWAKSPRMGGTSYWRLRMEGREFRLLPTDLPVFRQWVESQERDFQAWARGRVSN